MSSKIPIDSTSDYKLGFTQTFPHPGIQQSEKYHNSKAKTTELHRSVLFHCYWNHNESAKSGGSPAIAEKEMKRRYWNLEMLRDIEGMLWNEILFSKTLD